MRGIPVVTTYKNEHGKTGLSNSPDFKDRSVDWTGYDEDQARHTAWKFHNGLLNTEGAFAACAQNKILQGLLFHRRSGHIHAQTVHDVEGQDVPSRQ